MSENIKQRLDELKKVSAQLKDSATTDTNIDFGLINSIIESANNNKNASSVAQGQSKSAQQLPLMKFLMSNKEVPEVSQLPTNNNKAAKNGT